MIIIKIMGGLGNQLFQYALALEFEQMKVGVKLDLSSYKESDFRKCYLDYFDCNFEEASTKEIIRLKKKNQKIYSKIKRKIFKSCGSHIIEHKHFYKQEIIQCNNAYLEGFWQCEKYFLNIRHVILEKCSNFIFTNKNQEILNEIQLTENSIGVHIRRGDYLNNENIQRFGNICTIEYYNKAYTFFKERFNNNVFFVFTNDAKWVRDNIVFDNMVVIDWNSEDDGINDMLLMSKCKNNIIANSSFSWWGAWLNCNAEKIVISPKKWFNDEATPDIWCTDWLKM